MIKIINKISDFKASKASHKTLVAVGGFEDRYKLTASKVQCGIDYEISDEETPTTASTDIIFRAVSYKHAMEKLRELDDEDSEDVDPENIYGSATVRQSIEEERK